MCVCPFKHTRIIYDNDFTLIIDTYFYETFSTLTQNNLRLRFTL